MYMSNIVRKVREAISGNPTVIPEVNDRGRTLDEIYFNHPYRFITSDAQSLTTRYGHWSNGINALETWCNENCTGKWFNDLRRMADINGVLEQNEFGGDYLIFAFEFEVDCIMFNLQYP